MRRLVGYVWTVGVAALATGVCLLIAPYVERTNLVMVYLLGVTLVASRFGPGEAAFASVLSVGLFDVAFVPPRGTLAVHDPGVLLTFAAMLAVALLISRLTLRLREQARAAEARERRTAELHARSERLEEERERLAREGRAAQLQAESEGMRNALLSSISHDLRTPLTSIAGAAGALVAAGEGGELARTIVDEAERLRGQVGNLLDMTRLQSGGLRLRLGWESVEELVGTALARAQLGGRAVETRIAPGLPLLRVDGELVLKVLANLLENAAHHTPPDARVWVTASQGSKTVRIVVADDGPGLPPGAETAIFERFAQGGERGAGLGLGLAICRAAMRLHDGVVWAQNRAGGGAEFHVEFPLPTVQPEVPVG